MNKIDGILLDMGERYYPEHEYPSSYRDQNIKAIQEAKQAILADLLVLPELQIDGLHSNEEAKLINHIRQALTAYFEGMEE